ncbi:hypothetical protein [uncultured Desulfovibrio sp.]|uniref:hypothetical protein n=1 Tax=uncultured Desulfovibrio sp. TaxID=167968 RepID=UPI002711F774|nr:hypothetical protein [uncultured Desulfovibrio sp.]
MRVLFLDASYPGRLGPLAGRLAALPGNEVLFASSRQRREYSQPGVRRVLLRRPAPRRRECAGEQPALPTLWQEALKTGEYAAATLTTVAERGFVPDIIFSHAASGAAFFVPQLFPAAFHVAYADPGPRGAALSSSSARRVQLDMQSLQFLHSNLCFAFSERRKEQFPARLSAAIQLMPPFVDTDAFAPAEEQAADAAPLVIINARGLAQEQAREALHLALALLNGSGTRVALLTENARQTQRAEEAVRARAADAANRLLVADFLSFPEYRDLLARATVALCPPRREPATSFMLEAMSCEVLLMARAEAVNFLRPGVNMMELAGGSAADMAQAVLQTLASGQPRGRAREFLPVTRMARRNVLAHFSEAKVIPRHLAHVMQACAAWKKGRARA